VSSGSGVLVLGGCCFRCFWAWLCCVRGWLWWWRAWWRAGPRLPVMLPGGAVEARRSRVPRSGIASDAEGALDLGGTAPQAARHHHSHPRTQHQSVLDADAAGRMLFRVEKGVGCAPGVVVTGSGGLLQVGFPGVDKPAGGCRSSLRRGVAAWSATTGAVGRGQSEGATCHRGWES
jgi:hypothetical protein